MPSPTMSLPTRKRRPFAPIINVVLATSVMRLLQRGDLSLFEPFRAHPLKFRHEGVTA